MKEDILEDCPMNEDGDCIIRKLAVYSNNCGERVNFTGCYIDVCPIVYIMREMKGGEQMKPKAKMFTLINGEEVGIVIDKIVCWVPENGNTVVYTVDGDKVTIKEHPSRVAQLFDDES